MLGKAIIFGPGFSQGATCSYEPCSTGLNSLRLLLPSWSGLSAPPVTSLLALGSIWTNQLWLALYISYPCKAITYTNSKVQLTCCKLKSKKKWVPSSKNFLYPRNCANHHNKVVTWPSSRTPRWSFLALLEADITAEGETSMWTDRKHIVGNRPQVSAFFLGIQALSSWIAL